MRRSFAESGRFSRDLANPIRSLRAGGHAREDLGTGRTWPGRCVCSLNSGESVFREGEIASSAIVAEVQKRGGLLTQEDLLEYPATLARSRDRFVSGACELRAFRRPLPEGAVLVQALNVLEGFDLADPFARAVHRPFIS